MGPTTCFLLGWLTVHAYMTDDSYLACEIAIGCMKVYEALKCIKDKFHFHLIPADGSIQEVRLLSDRSRYW